MKNVKPENNQIIEGFFGAIWKAITCDRSCRARERAAAAAEAKRKKEEEALKATQHARLVQTDGAASDFGQVATYAEQMSTIEKTREIQNKIDRYNSAFETAKSNIALNIQKRKNAANVEKTNIYNEHAKWLGEMPERARARANNAVPIIETMVPAAKRKAQEARNKMFNKVVDIQKNRNQEENRRKKAERERAATEAAAKAAAEEAERARIQREEEHAEEIIETAVNTKIENAFKSINTIDKSDGVGGSIVEKDRQETSVFQTPSTQPFSNLMQNLFLEPFSVKKEGFCSCNDIMQTGGTIREGLTTNSPSLSYPCLQSENEENPKHPTEFYTFFSIFGTAPSPTSADKTIFLNSFTDGQCGKTLAQLMDLSANLLASKEIVQKKIDCINYQLNNNLTGYDSLSITPLEEQLKEHSNATYVPFIYYLSVSIVLTFLIFSGK